MQHRYMHGMGTSRALLEYEYLSTHTIEAIVHVAQVVQ